MKTETRVKQELAELEKAIKENPNLFAQKAKEKTIEDLKNSLYGLADNLFAVLSSSVTTPPQVVKDEVEVYTPDTLSKKIGVSKAVLRSWRYHGRGPRYFKDGSLTFYTADAVKEWIDSKKQVMTTAESFAANP